MKGYDVWLSTNPAEEAAHAEEEAHELYVEHYADADLLGNWLVETVMGCADRCLDGDTFRALCRLLQAGIETLSRDEIATLRQALDASVPIYGEQS